MPQVFKSTRIKQVEKASLLGAASLLISTGVAVVDKTPIPAIILIVLGIGCFVFRELRKK